MSTFTVKREDGILKNDIIKLLSVRFLCKEESDGSLMLRQRDLVDCALPNPIHLTGFNSSFAGLLLADSKFTDPNGSSLEYEPSRLVASGLRWKTSQFNEVAVKDYDSAVKEMFAKMLRQPCCAFIFDANQDVNSQVEAYARYEAFSTVSDLSKGPLLLCDRHISDLPFFPEKMAFIDVQYLATLPGFEDTRVVDAPTWSSVHQDGPVLIPMPLKKVEVYWDQWYSSIGKTRRVAITKKNETRPIKNHLLLALEFVLACDRDYLCVVMPLTSNNRESNENIIKAAQELLMLIGREFYLMESGPTMFPQLTVAFTQKAPREKVKECVCSLASMVEVVITRYSVNLKIAHGKKTSISKSIVACFKEKVLRITPQDRKPYRMDGHVAAVVPEKELFPGKASFLNELNSTCAAPGEDLFFLKPKESVLPNAFQAALLGNDEPEEEQSPAPTLVSALLGELEGSPDEGEVPLSLPPPLPPRQPSGQMTEPATPTTPVSLDEEEVKPISYIPPVISLPSTTTPVDELSREQLLSMARAKASSKKKWKRSNQS